MQLPLRVTCVLACAAAVAVSLVPATGAWASVPRQAPPVLGLDISTFQHANGPINWRLLARHGMHFVAIKVSEGTYYTNPYYATDARAAAAARLYVMPYVFANPRSSGGAAQARFGVAAARYWRGRAKLPLVVDLENDPYASTDNTGDCYGLGAWRMIDWIGSFISEATALTGKRPIIYTTAAWWRECTDRTGRFWRDPLWVAAYDTRVPRVPWPWTRWTFWQYTNSAWLPGVGLTDVDFFHPTAALPSLRDVTAKRAKQPRPRPGPRPHQRPAPHHATRPPKVTRRPQSAVARTSWIPPYATGPTGR
jgi:lysozyme